MPTGKVVYSPSVTATGTAYYIRSNRGCGKYVELVKAPLAGVAEVLLALPNGYDADVTYATLRPPRGPTPIDHRRLFRPRSLRTEHLGHLPGRRPGGAAAPAALGYPVLATMTSS